MIIMETPSSFLAKKVFFVAGRAVLMALSVATIIQGILFQLETDSFTAAIYYSIGFLVYIISIWVHNKEKELLNLEE